MDFPDKTKLKEIFERVEVIRGKPGGNPDIMQDKESVESMVSEVDEMLEELSKMDQSHEIVFDITQDLKMARIILQRHEMINNMKEA